MIKELVLKNRSYRRFYGDKKVSMATLRDLVELARLSSFGGNKQSLKFYLSDGDMNGPVYDCLGWAAYLPDWDGPAPDERPAAYIVMLNDNNIMSGADVNAGIAAANMLLGAAEAGLGGCMFGNVDRKKLAGLLKLPENLEIVLVIALGVPKEEVVIEPIGPDGDVRYWRDGNRVHHVPKRALEEIIYIL